MFRALLLVLMVVAGCGLFDPLDEELVTQNNTSNNGTNDCEETCSGSTPICFDTECVACTTTDHCGGEPCQEQMCRPCLDAGECKKRPNSIAACGFPLTGCAWECAAGFSDANADLADGCENEL